MNEQVEREINFLDLIGYVLKRWRSIIIVALIGILVLGAYKTVNTELTRININKMIEEGNENLVIYPSDYQAALDALSAKQRQIRALEVEISTNENELKNLEYEIKNLEYSISSQEQNLVVIKQRKEDTIVNRDILAAYIENSAFMKMDATSQPIASKTYQVRFTGDIVSTYSMFRDPSDEITSAYASDITLNDEKNPITQKYGIQIKYLDELWWIEADVDTNTVTVTAYGETEEMAKAIRDYVCELVLAKHDELAERYTEHSIALVDETYKEIISQSLTDSQIAKRMQLTSYDTQISEYTINISSAQDAIEKMNTEISTTKKAIQDLEDTMEEQEEDLLAIQKEIISQGLESKIESTKPSLSRSIKEGIKFGVIAGVVVAVLLAVLYAALYILSGKLHTAKEITSYYNITILAALNRKPFKKKMNAIDKWIAKIGCGKNQITDEELLKNAASSLEIIREGANNIVVYSSLPQADVLAFVEKFGKVMPNISFSAVSTAALCPENATILNAADGVILLEEREQATIKEIDAELEQVALFDKKVFGAVIA